MSLLDTLDLILAMSYVYLLFALMATAINEGIASIRGSRAMWLKRGLRSLLGSDSAVDALQRNPLIAYLSLGQRYAASYLPASNVLNAILTDPAFHQAAEKLPTTVDEVNVAISKLPAASPIRAVLEGLLQSANNDLAQFRLGFKEWYAQFENQVSSWYRQRTHYVLFGISLGLALAFNVDTLALVRTLSTDAPARAAITERALRIAESQKLANTEAEAWHDANTALGTAQKVLDELPAGTDRANAQQTVDDRARDLEQAQQAYANALRAEMAFAQGAGLPIGWTREEADTLCRSAWAMLAKLIGLLLSALAISLGAPFWFNMLRQVASIRSVGKSVAEFNAEQTARSPRRTRWTRRNQPTTTAPGA